MAASYLYSLTSSDVIAQLGIDGQNIGAATQPVSTADLTTWLNDGAGRFNSVLAKSGITADANLDADAHQMIASGIKAYAVHKALLVMGHTGPMLDAAEREWLAIYAEISNAPQQLGAAYDGGLTTASDGVSSTDRAGYDGFFSTTTGKDIIW